LKRCNESKVVYIAQAQLNGLTGNIRFDQRGRRESFGLDLMELKIDGLKKVCIIAYAYTLGF